MVITETVEINGTQFTRNYSNSNYYIKRDGIKYAEAIDPMGTDRVYTETEEVIPNYDSEMVE
jgi:hypothetical protein